MTPPDAPAPTMKSLDQIEARTPISSAPFTITASGSYYLTTNVTVSSGNAITVSANNVMLDLNGFTISSTENPAVYTYGVLLNAVMNITIVNGFISGGVTNNVGTYSGSGFGTGISYGNGFPANVRVSGVSVSGCQYDGIFLGYENTMAESCNVNTVGGDGIFAQSVSDSTARNCGSVGVYAVTVNNCYGSGSGSAYGVLAKNASNCYGYSESSQGINAVNASNCFGESGSNRGLFANVAISSYGLCHGGSYGLFATSVANTCYGSSATGTGLNAYIAIGCTGSSVAYTYHYNMPP